LVSQGRTCSREDDDNGGDVDDDDDPEDLVQGLEEDNSCHEGGEVVGYAVAAAVAVAVGDTVAIGRK
jgi:hypothetical protein